MSAGQTDTPWPTRQPRSCIRRRCRSVSIPSATTVRPRSSTTRTKPVIKRRHRSSETARSVEERSIFTASRSKSTSQLRLEYPRPKSTRESRARRQLGPQGAEGEANQLSSGEGPAKPNGSSEAHPPTPHNLPRRAGAPSRPAAAETPPCQDASQHPLKLNPLEPNRLKLNPVQQEYPSADLYVTGSK